MEVLRVVIQGDVRVYREGLASVLAEKQGIEIVGTAATAEQAVGCVAHQHADIIVVTESLPGAKHVIRRVTLAHPRVGVLALGVPENANAVLACVEAGASAFVTSEASMSDVLAALGDVARGEARYSPRIAAALLRRLAMLAQASDPPIEAVLTRREVDVARLIGQGLSNKEIARHLGIELSTVKGHVHNILEKLGVRRRSEIVVRMRHYGRARAAAVGERI